MHNIYLREIFTEGLGNLFYMKYYSFLKKKVKNSLLQKILIIIHTIIYLLFISLIAFLLFKISFPL